MRFKGNVTKIFPIILVSFYIMLFFIDWIYPSEFYNNIDSEIVFIDTFLMGLSTMGIIFFYKSWSKIAVLSYITVVLANILTEINERIPLHYYYKIYLLIIILFGISIIIFSKTPKVFHVIRYKILKRNL